ncbi:MAG: saccharopine dehydrogenase C-terminal domain-containing protein [Candidatus Thermoplasmatota archaeon]|nr:saccharopine dehydrogenase C-terminal domain-containing protein [Candidatus Thermoplasmatota archaeon]
MKKVLVLGAGMVSRPLVRYLLNQPDVYVKMASRTVSKAEKIINAHPKGEAVSLDVNDDMSLEKLVSDADIVVSLLPYMYHVKVAEHCIRYGKHMVTTSYVSDAMQALDKKAREEGIIILNEIGLDPGIDHMSAMKIIHAIHDKGGKVKSFSSYCGALPAPEASNNPFGYKFSWSSKGVLLASKNAAKYLENGKEVRVLGGKLFEHYAIKTIEGAGHFENYPNRNSIPYIDVYDIPETETIYRGTLRNIGWCETMKKIADLGYLDETERDDIKELTFKEFLRKLIKSTEGNDLKKDLAKYLGIDTYSAVMKRLEWLGLLSDKPLPKDKKSPIDILNNKMLEKLKFESGERDMIVLRHEFIAEYPQHDREYITSTLIEYGVPHEDFAVARTVGLPAAIAVKMILKEKIVIRGVHIPVIPEIYNPVLDELEQMGITFKEKTEVLHT